MSFLFAPTSTGVLHVVLPQRLAGLRSGPGRTLAALESSCGDVRRLRHETARPREEIRRAHGCGMFRPMAAMWRSKVSKKHCTYRPLDDVLQLMLPAAPNGVFQHRQCQLARAAASSSMPWGRGFGLDPRAMIGEASRGEIADIAFHPRSSPDLTENAALQQKNDAGDAASSSVRTPPRGRREAPHSTIRIDYWWRFHVQTRPTPRNLRPSNNVEQHRSELRFL